MSFLSVRMKISLGLMLAVSCAHAAEVSFRNDVSAVIAKSGCNLGSCHGNATGKGGFKMSLRGSDLDLDYAALTQDARGRRVNEFEPERSLILEKATQALAHEGGKRFAKDSWEYKTLRDWLVQGAKRSTKDEPKLEKLEVTPRDQILVEPENKVQIKAMATFSDGTQRDVSSTAVYDLAQVGLVKVSRDGRVDKLKDGEPTIIVRFLDKQQPVRLAFVPARPAFVWTAPRQNNAIDHFVFSKLKSLRMTPSKLCDDSVFARRVFLDLVGASPTADEAVAFVSDKAPDKRERLVDKLLTRTEFADFWALKWCDALRVESRTMDVKGMTVFHEWIRNEVAKNTAVDKFVHGILAAQGSTYTVPETNFYRALREPNVRAEAIAQVFLGTRLKCAQCHNHPFDKWTQDDYFNWAAVFARVDYDVKENLRKDKNDKHEFIGEQIVKLTKEASLSNPRTGDPAKAKLLGANLLNDETTGGMKDLDAAADWTVNPNNALFAQAQVNRIWFHLMGRGLVDPVDDFRATNPASHPNLLKALAKEFVESGFDMRRIIRTITASRTYQLDSAPNENNADDQTNYSHTVVRRLGAEQLFDTLHQFLGVPGEFKFNPEISRASQLPGPISGRRRDSDPSSDEAFLKQFGSPPRLLACECERSNEPAMPQAFQLISSPKVDALIRKKRNIIGVLLKSKLSMDEKVDALFWSALSRPATDVERKQFAAQVSNAVDHRAAMEDIAWSLVNAKEFVLRK